MTPHKLTLAERDTSIVFCDADDTATICTFSQAWITRLDKLAAECPKFVRKSAREGYREYNFPKNLVRIAKPPTISEEQRAKMADNLKNNLAKQNLHKEV